MNSTQGQTYKNNYFKTYENNRLSKTTLHLITNESKRLPTHAHRKVERKVYTN